MRLAPLAIAAIVLQFPSRPPDIPFRMHAIDPGASETAAVADVNRDGRLDIISGEYWYQGSANEPRWTQHRFRTLGFSNQYIDNFSDLPIDVDADGYPDIVSVSWFAKKVAWWRNPGKSKGEWTEGEIHQGFNVEFAILADVDNDGRALEVVAQENGTPQAWYEVKGGRWLRHEISDRTYGHGIGAGDVNGDRRTDVLTPRGWLEAPADPRSGNWKFHAAWESVNTPVTSPKPDAQPPAKPGPVAVSQLGFMHVLDVNGDGRNDVIAAAGHDYGVYWFEQGENGQWTRRTIDAAWSQGHASTLADLNGDGRPDLVTGKRFMAHNGSDPGEREPLGVYWYELRRPGDSHGGQSPVTVPALEWVRHLIDYGGRTGAGMQLPVVDIDGDGDLDLVCPGKSGLFLGENLTKNNRSR